MKYCENVYKISDPVGVVVMDASLLVEQFPQSVGRRSVREVHSGRTRQTQKEREGCDSAKGSDPRAHISAQLYSLSLVPRPIRHFIHTSPI